ncbi:hypothetical protein J132_08379, partial [Termitomyces sp. J132]
GVIKRGHIYFYRFKVQHRDEGAELFNEVRNTYMFFVPQPSKFSVDKNNKNKSEPTKNGNSNDIGDSDNTETQILSAGTDAVPGTETLYSSKKYFRLMTIGKKPLPDPEIGGHSKGVKHPEGIMQHVFEKGGGKGRKSYDLRFVRLERWSCYIIKVRRC